MSLSFLWANILKALCLIATRFANLEGQRSHEYLTARGAVVRARKSQMVPQIVSIACGRLSGECRRGTQECVRHTGDTKLSDIGHPSLRLVKSLVYGVERGDELKPENIGLRAGEVLDLQPFIARLEQLMPVEPPAATQLIRCDPR